MTGAPFANDRERDGAAAVIAACAAARGGWDPRDVLLDRLHPDGDGHLTGDGTDPVTAVDVAAGAAALLSRLFADVNLLLAISPDATLASAGLWVATDGRPRG